MSDSFLTLVYCYINNNRRFKPLSSYGSELNQIRRSFCSTLHCPDGSWVFFIESQNESLTFLSLSYFTKIWSKKQRSLRWKVRTGSDSLRLGFVAHYFLDLLKVFIEIQTKTRWAFFTRLQFASILLSPPRELSGLPSGFAIVFCDVDWSRKCAIEIRPLVYTEAFF